MKVVILAGGKGTRLAEETSVKPKPMVEIGGKPILWHIMKHYSHFGFNKFVIALGYKGEVIKDYFVNYDYRNTAGLTVELGKENLIFNYASHSSPKEKWTVHLIDTGEDTQTGGRIAKAAEFVGKEAFLLTYGDGIGTVDIKNLIETHKYHNALVTVTAVHPPARFGALNIKNDLVENFMEKPTAPDAWINGGFFVIEPEACEYITKDTFTKLDESIWEQKPLRSIAAAGRLAAHRHEGFWNCVDTLRDLQYLNSLWEKGNPPWKIW